MTRSKLVFICLLLVCCKTNLHEQFSKTSNGPKQIWLIPDTITAEKIARAVWEAHLDPEIISSEVLKAELKDDSIWVVKSLKKQFYNSNKGKMENYKKGEGLLLELSKRDGRIKKIEVIR